MYKQMREYLVIYEEAVGLGARALPNFYFCFNSVKYRNGGCTLFFLYINPFLICSVQDKRLPGTLKQIFLTKRRVYFMGPTSFSSPV
jgi:hypothetical protein